MVKNFEIPEEMIEVIYNPVDNEKFQPKNSSQEDYFLFVGTIDYLRKEAILDLVEYTQKIGKELWLVGENNGNYLQNLLLEPNVKHFPSRKNNN
jgi:glycosyltransferase involved in cell wall biosynthesis